MATTLQINSEQTLLSPRQAEALLPLALGDSNQEIADQMDITTRTVKEHVQVTKEKLFAENRAHMVTEAFRHGILKFMCVTFMLLGLGTTLTNPNSDLRGRPPRTTRVTRTIRNVRRQPEIDDLLELANV